MRHYLISRFCAESASPWLRCRAFAYGTDMAATPQAFRAECYLWCCDWLKLFGWLAARKPCRKTEAQNYPFIYWLIYFVFCKVRMWKWYIATVWFTRVSQQETTNETWYKTRQKVMLCIYYNKKIKKRKKEKKTKAFDIGTVLTLTDLNKYTVISSTSLHPSHHPPPLPPPPPNWNKRSVIGCL